MILETIPQIGQLSADDRLRLASEIVEQVARERDDLPVAPEHLELLEASRRHYQADPGQVRSWEDVKRGLVERTAKAVPGWEGIEIAWDDRESLFEDPDYRDHVDP